MDHLKEKNQPQGLDEIDAMLSEFTVLSADELLGGQAAPPAQPEPLPEIPAAEAEKPEAAEEPEPEP